MPLQLYEIRLSRHYELAPKVKHFVFEFVKNEAFSYIPGQFIRLHFRNANGEEVRRSYSLANQHSPTKSIEFAASYVEQGFASELLFNMEIGSTLMMSGPVGKLVLNQETENFKRHVFVATGTGVTPFLSMLEPIGKLLESKAIDEALFLQGVRTKKDVLYKEAFKTFCNKHQKASFIPCFSQESAKNLIGLEKEGYVQRQFDSLSLNPQSDKIYLCGNPAMIDEAFSHLKEGQFENKQIIREKYISSK